MSASRRPLALPALAAGALLLVALGAGAQPSAAELAERWLLRTCDLGSAGLERALLAQSAAVARIFASAFRTGPPPGLVAGVEQAARDRFARRQHTLAEPGGTGLSRDDLDRAAQIGEADFVARAHEAFVLGYRTQALRGLVVVHPDLARALLEDESQDPDSPLQETAARLLARLP